MIESIQGGEGRQTRLGGAKGRPHPAAERVQDLAEGKPIYSWIDRIMKEPS